MSVKILIVFVCTAVGTLVGFLIMLRYKRNSAYFEGICAVISELKRNISYRRDSASQVLGGMNIESAQLKKNVGEYIEYAKGTSDKPTISRGFLSEEAYSRVCELFGSLGRADSATQIRELDMFSETFGKLSAAAKQKSDKLGAVAVKIGFLLGLGVGILTL